MYSDFPNIKKQMKKNDITFTHGSERSGMETCIQICLKIVFVCTNTYLKQCMSCFLMFKSPMS